MKNLILSLQNILMANGVAGQRFGNTSDDVFQIAQIMSELNSVCTKDEVQTIQTSLNIHPKVWQKFGRILNDSRLAKMHEQGKTLPGSYTALYALSVMKGIEFRAFMYENILKQNTSTRFIIDWNKEYREMCQL
jgi:hypothetical protein